MTIKVVNREDPEIFYIYENVDVVRSATNETGLFCKQLVIGDETATFPIMDWKFYELGFYEI